METVLAMPIKMIVVFVLMGTVGILKIKIKTVMETVLEKQ